jgi:hypothetical protein
VHQCCGVQCVAGTDASTLAMRDVAQSRVNGAIGIGPVAQRRHARRPGSDRDMLGSISGRRFGEATSRVDGRRGVSAEPSRHVPRADNPTELVCNAGRSVALARTQLAMCQHAY